SGLMTQEDVAMTVGMAALSMRRHARTFVMQLTQQIVRSLRLTTLMVTHSMAQALQFGDRTVMFHRGRIVFDVAGEQRAAMNVSDLLRLFRRDQGEELTDDALLLS